ncbi:MAG: nucleoside monophosphate kinase [bacterium]|nr:MAG: nucleoside monophosphate kinase [bacterium]
MRIVIAGKPGSGKGTQAALLSDRMNIPHLSSGEILRAEIRNATAFGKEVQEYVRRGEIGPERLITSVILEFIERKKYGKGFVLDGFPRTIYQARELDRRFSPSLCILLTLPDETIFSRLPNRLTCTACGRVYNVRELLPEREGRCDGCGSELVHRIDDRHETVERRLEIFREESAPVLDHYRRSNRLVPVDATHSPDAILRDIIKALESLELTNPV